MNLLDPSDLAAFIFHPIHSGTQDSVDELWRGFCPENLGQLHCFVYRDFVWGVRSVVHFIESQTQNVAFNGRELPHRPCRRELLYALVYFTSPLSDALRQFHCVVRGLLCQPCFFSKPKQRRFSRVRYQVSFEQGLQGGNPGLAPWVDGRGGPL